MSLLVLGLDRNVVDYGLWNVQACFETLSVCTVGDGNRFGKHLPFPIASVEANVVVDSVLEDYFDEAGILEVAALEDNIDQVTIVECRVFEGAVVELNTIVSATAPDLHNEPCPRCVVKRQAFDAERDARCFPATFHCVDALVSERSLDDSKATFTPARIFVIDPLIDLGHLPLPILYHNRVRYDVVDMDTLVQQMTGD